MHIAYCGVGFGVSFFNFFKMTNNREQDNLLMCIKYTLVNIVIFLVIIEKNYCLDEKLIADKLNKNYIYGNKLIPTLTKKLKNEKDRRLLPAFSFKKPKI